MKSYRRKTPGSIPTALTALVACVAMHGIAAQAGEISLFEGPGFAGRQVSLRATAASVRDIGFNDRTSSIVVRAGRWEVCSDDNFRGECAIFEPGQYATLDGRFDKRVSSAREVAVVGANPEPVSVAGIGSIELFGQPNFRGRTMQLTEDADNFNAMNFNDRASSLIVQGGTWELCTDAGFQGNCRTFAPGRYPTLGYGMAKSLSSARPVMAQQQPPVVHGGGWNRQRQHDAAESAPIVLFANESTRGRSIAISSDLPDLVPANFNDAAQSLVIESGYWEFCSDSYYRGQCRVLGPGQYQRLEPVLYRTISSIRAASRDARNDAGGGGGGGGRGRGREAGDIELYTAAGFAGNRFPLRQDLSNFNSGGFNDQIGSVIVNSGQWEMCTDAGYRGSCTVFGPGRYSGLGGLTNQLSSLRRIE